MGKTEEDNTNNDNNNYNENNVMCYRLISAVDRYRCAINGSVVSANIDRS